MKAAHPTLQEWWPKVKAQFPDAHVSWTYRGQKDQELFFQMGKTRAHFPSSRHNRMPAEAMDLFKIREDKIAAWPKEWFESIWAWLEAQGAPLVWGGTWKTLGDGDHFQIKD